MIICGKVASSALLVAKRRSRVGKMLAAWYRVASQSVQAERPESVRTENLTVSRRQTTCLAKCD
eukprot:3291896-Amphidinium_carterae.1